MLDVLFNNLNIYNIFIFNDLFVFVSFCPFIFSKQTLPNKDNNDIIIIKKNFNNFGSYLACLIEGEGSIYTLDFIRNKKGN